MAEMKRCLLTLRKGRCPFHCVYCFARFSQYEKQFTLDDVIANPSLIEGVEVVYPSCDNDLFAFADAVDLLRRTASLGVSISVSTKAVLPEATVQDLAVLSSELENNGHVIKVGISFSTKDVESLEPGSANYDSRIRNLQHLHSYNIASCAIIKPILRYRPIEEYISIVEDCRPFTESLLIGDEYVDSTSEVSEGDIAFRKVNWLRGEPQWPVREAKATKGALLSFAKSLKYEVYESDIGLMEKIIRERTDSYASTL